jgi:hypothetical protein
MVIGEPQKPLHLLFILRPWPVFYIFDIPEDCSKTAFITKYGLFDFDRMAFGLCNSPATYARVINLVLRGLNWKVVLAFLDDMLVLKNLSTSFSFLGLGQFSISLIYPGPMCIPLGPTTLPRNSTSVETMWVSTMVWITGP